VKQIMTAPVHTWDVKVLWSFPNVFLQLIHDQDYDTFCQII